jgi:primary-amine oxidase
MFPRMNMLSRAAIAFLVPALAHAQGANRFEPLTADEITRASDVLRTAGRADNGTTFISITLHEPAKADVLAGRASPREAAVLLYQPAGRVTAEATVDLTARRVSSWKVVPNVQPPFTPGEYARLQNIVRADAGWQAAMRKRGLAHFDSIQIDPWSAGSFGLPGEEGKRIWRMLSYFKGSAQNAYARPIEGVVAVVDINAGRVLRLVDTGVIPVRKQADDYDTATARAREGKLRDPLKPLMITQPNGASFTLNGHEVRWQRWRFRFAVLPREGLVLYDVGFEDHGRVRPIVYRASLSDMVVPYGDPSQTWFFRNAFDAGEYGLWGFLGAPLDPKVDAPPNATFVDAAVTDEQGKGTVFRRAAALYEKDGGTMWKHVADTSDGRRARDLVLKMVTTVGNYEYGFHWIFHQDGVLEQETELTGIMQTKAVADNGMMSHAHMVAPQLAAVHHQHFFNFRLDMDVDGAANTVSELNTRSDAESAVNPWSNAFDVSETPFRREHEAKRQLDLTTARVWKIASAQTKNSLGEPTSYLLIPGGSAVPYARPASSVRKRAGFLDAALWVTPYAADEMHAAGDFVNQSPGGDGLTRWTRADRPIANRDVVLWYTMGITHIPRPEDWPVMNVVSVGFKLMPAGFFSRNPALDVP